jgi:hypothetical protein
MLLLGWQRDADVPVASAPCQRGRSHDLGSGFSELDRCLTGITDTSDVSDVGSLLISIINEPRRAQQLAIVTDHEGFGRRVSDHVSNIRNRAGSIRNPSRSNRRALHIRTRRLASGGHNA